MLRALVLAYVLSGCDIALGIDGLVADRTPCAGPCGEPSTMVEVASPAGTFRIDAFEVTNAEYQAFLDADPDLGSQRTTCSWNDSVVPGVLSQSFLDAAEDYNFPIEVDPACATWLEDELAGGGSDRPACCVDWCDAAAYCAWAGKRLCGTIGSGSEIDVTGENAMLSDATVSEWYRSCSFDGSQLFPYGNGYQQSVCNDANHGNETVGSREGCEGGVPGLFDMSGNVDEWEDACTHFNNPDPIQNCFRRGGAYWAVEDGLLCSAGRDTQRGTQGNSTGFRCCTGP